MSIHASTRPPAVAGRFYPGRAAELDATIRELLAKVEAPSAEDPPKALIAPHAGYVYSGPVAASAYARLRPHAERIERVVLLGPAHRVYLDGLALPEATRFATPLGEIAIDAELAAELARLPQVIRSDAAHAAEHSLEVQLPFLQEVLGEFSLIPLVVGRASPSDVAEVLAKAWGGPETLIVISSDLSHYHGYEQAQRLDRATAEFIVESRGPGVDPERACGAKCIDGLLELGRRRPMRIELLDLRNSGDTAGPRDQVVGYGAFAVHEGEGSS